MGSNRVLVAYRSKEGDLLAFIRPNLLERAFKPAFEDDVLFTLGEIVWIVILRWKLVIEDLHSIEFQLVNAFVLVVLLTLEQFAYCLTPKLIWLQKICVKVVHQAHPIQLLLRRLVVLT